MFSFCHNFCWLLGESFINCENLTDYWCYIHFVGEWCELNEFSLTTYIRFIRKIRRQTYLYRLI